MRIRPRIFCLGVSCMGFWWMDQDEFVTLRVTPEYIFPITDRSPDTVIAATPTYSSFATTSSSAPLMHHRTCVSKRAMRIIWVVF